MLAGADACGLLGAIGGDDGLLLALLLHLRCKHALKLASASSSLARRLSATSAASSSSSGSGEPAAAPSILDRVAAAHFLGARGSSSFAAAAALSHRSAQLFTGCGNVGSEALVLLRVLESSLPMAKAMRLLLELTLSPEAVGGGGTFTAIAGVSAARARAFNEALFHAELWHCDDKGSKRRAEEDEEEPGGKGDGRAPSSSALVAICNQLLTRTLLTDFGGPFVVAASAGAVRSAELELDALVEEQRFHNAGAYEVVAIQRSAAEFLRRRLDAALSARGVAAKRAASPPPPATKAQVGKPSQIWQASPCDVGGAAAREELEAAVADLDKTIDGYMCEGYDLHCPRLLGRLSRQAVPHSHWWLGVSCRSPGAARYRQPFAVEHAF